MIGHDDSTGTATAFPNDANLNWEKEGSTEEDMLAIQWQHEEDDMLAIQWQCEGLILIILSTVDMMLLIRTMDYLSGLDT